MMDPTPYGSGSVSCAVNPVAHHGGAVGVPVPLGSAGQEAEDRRQRRIGRLRTASRLPAGKTWETFEHDRVPLALRQQLGELADGSFVDRGVNVLAFGLPGTGKTHALCALGHRLVEAGRSVLFAGLRTWPPSRGPATGRHPPGTGGCSSPPNATNAGPWATSNLVFSQWEISSPTQWPAAAIDRVVHHSVILEFRPKLPHRRPRDRG